MNKKDILFMKEWQEKQISSKRKLGSKDMERRKTRRNEQADGVGAVRRNSAKAAGGNWRAQQKLVFGCKRAGGDSQGDTGECVPEIPLRPSAARSSLERTEKNRIKEVAGIKSAAFPAAV